MSRSVTTPTRRSPWQTGREPTSSVFMRWAASWTVASGLMHSASLVMISRTRMANSFFCGLWMLRNVCFAIAKPAATDAITQSGDARLLGAIRTTENRVVLLNAVADHRATAMGTARRQSMDGALKRIKDVLAPFHGHGV